MHVSLDKQSYYEAIFYTWGGEKPTLDMTDDGKILEVTYSCGLRHSILSSNLSALSILLDRCCVYQSRHR
jgi:hypothetical protein